MGICSSQMTFNKIFLQNFQTKNILNNDQTPPERFDLISPKKKFLFSPLIGHFPHPTQINYIRPPQTTNIPHPAVLIKLPCYPSTKISFPQTSHPPQNLPAARNIYSRMRRPWPSSSVHWPSLNPQTSSCLFTIGLPKWSTTGPNRLSLHRETGPPTAGPTWAS